LTLRHDVSVVSSLYSVHSGEILPGQPQDLENDTQHFLWSPEIRKFVLLIVYSAADSKNDPWRLIVERKLRLANKRISDGVWKD